MKRKFVKVNGWDDKDKMYLLSGMTYQVKLLYLTCFEDQFLFSDLTLTFFLTFE